MVGLTLGAGAGPRRPQGRGRRSYAGGCGAGCEIRRPGLGAGLLVRAHVRGTGRLGTPRPDRAAHPRHPRHRRRPRPRALALLAAFRSPRDRPSPWATSPRTATSAWRCTRHCPRRTASCWRRPPRARLHDQRCERDSGPRSREGMLSAQLMVAAEGRGLADAREDGHRPHRLVLSAMGNRGDGGA